MKLVSLGCSLMAGTELSDATDSRHSQLTWPALLASRFGLEYRCWAQGGSGNLCILDRLLSLIHRRPEFMYVIQWTYIDRFDHSDPHGAHFNQGLNDWHTVLPGDDSARSRFYYRNLHSEYRDKIASLCYIQTAIAALQKNNCRYLMTCVDDLLWCDRYHCSPGMAAGQRWAKSHMHWFDGRNFVDWSRREGHTVSKAGHPLEQAHSAAADLMEPVIDAILHRA